MILVVRFLIKIKVIPMKLDLVIVVHNSRSDLMNVYVYDSMISQRVQARCAHPDLVQDYVIVIYA